MLYQLETKIKLTLEHEPGWTTSKHKECKIQLNIPSNFDANQYFDKEGNLTANGAKSQTIVMLSGISANIHASHPFSFFNEFLYYCLYLLLVQ